MTDHAYLPLNFKDLLGEIIGSPFEAEKYFEGCFIRYHAGYGGHARVVTVADSTAAHSGPGQALVPSVEFDVGALTCEQFVHLIGKLSKHAIIKVSPRIKT